MCDPGLHSFVARPDERESGSGPYLDRIVLRVFSDKESALRELEGGGLDVLFRIPRDAAQRLKENDRLVLHQFPTHAYFYVV